MPSGVVPWTCASCGHMQVLAFGRCARCGFPAEPPAANQRGLRSASPEPPALITVLNVLLALVFIPLNLAASCLGIAAAIPGDGPKYGIYVTGIYFGNANIVSIGGFVLALWHHKPHPFVWLVPFIPLTYGVFIVFLMIWTALGGH